MLGRNRIEDMFKLIHAHLSQAFAATEQIESYTAIASGQLMTLSTQQMTSCTPNPLVSTYITPNTRFVFLTLAFNPLDMWR